MCLGNVCEVVGGINNALIFVRCLENLHAGSGVLLGVTPSQMSASTKIKTSIYSIFFHAVNMWPFCVSDLLFTVLQS